MRKRPLDMENLHLYARMPNWDIDETHCTRRCMIAESARTHIG